MRTDPWRQVTHIEIVETAKGARYYNLTLECGDHHKTFIRPFRFARFLGSGSLNSKLDLAPKRVRCLLCGVQERMKAL
jgi:hypothetical protein